MGWKKGNDRVTAMERGQRGLEETTLTPIPRCMLGSLVATYCAAAAHVADVDAGFDGETARAGSASDTVRGDMLVGALAG